MAEFFQRIITSFVLGACFWLSFIYCSPIVFSFVLLTILLFIMIFEWRRFFSLHRFFFWIMLPFYPVMPFVLLIIMNQNPLYHNLLLPLFVIVASHDTGSYIVGTFLGKHKICPHISPSKTWEGFFGGYLFATVAFAFLMLFESPKSLPWWKILSFSFIICVLAFMGDMFESWLKRRVGIKHSGEMLPGHGGFLDRFDGIMFAGVFFYIFKDYLVQLFS